MAFTASPASFNSHYAVSAWREQVYLAGVRDGAFVPFVLPFFWYGGILLLLHMLLPTLQGRVARLATFALSTVFHVWVILRCRAYSPNAGFAIGILSSWNILWAAAVLVFADAKRSFKRVKREGEVTAAPGLQDRFQVLQANRHHVHAANDHQIHKRHVNSANGKPNGSPEHGAAQKTIAQSTIYVWQSFPAKNLLDRLGWSCDLVTNFRGIGWNWKISGVPSRPSFVDASLRGVELAQAALEDRPFSSSGRRRFDGKGALLLHNIWLVVLGYLILDVLKTIMNHDPYFWGLTDQPAPTYLPLFIRASVVLTRMYRLTVSICFLWATLRTIFALAPILYVGLFGAKVLGCNGEAWMYPDQYGSYKSVFERGLAGWWGGWWHQIFRYGFQSGGRWLAGDLLRLKESSPLSAVVQLCVSFDLSGLMHAAASMTMIGNTSPWKGQFFFFALQPIGIIGGLVWSHLLKRSGLARRMPRWVGWMGNFIYVHAWLYFTLPLLIDDLARGGLMLYEPVGLSPLRGLGLGAAGDGFYCWAGMRIAWHQDQKWWRSGIAL